MRVFFREFGANLVRCFAWPNLLAHLSAIFLTVVAVATGFDWWWYDAARGVPRALLFPGILLGGLLPIVAPFVVLAVGKLRKSGFTVRLAGALGQAGFLGWLISSAYKAFTGRAHPEFGALLTRDISRDFSFGFLRGGVFWGWPSSHTTVAFATAVALVVMVRRKPLPSFLAMAYALYVGLAVSVSIHWFSDFAAGALIGTVIGLAVGKSFDKS